MKDTNNKELTLNDTLKICEFKKYFEKNYTGANNTTKDIYLSFLKYEEFISNHNKETNK